MKLSGKISIPFFFRGIIFLLIILCFCSSNLLFAQKNNKASRTELQKKRKVLYEDMNNTKDILRTTRSEKKASLNELILVQKKIQNRNQIISNLAENLDLLDNRIADIEFQIDSLGIALEELQEDYAKSARNAYINRSDYHKLLFLFSAKNVNDAYRRMKYLDYYRQFRKDQVLSIYSTHETLKLKLADLQKEKDEHSHLLSSRQKERETLEAEKVNKDQLLKSLKTKEKQMEQKLREKQNALDDLNKQIKSLIAKATATNPKGATDDKKLKLDNSPEAQKLSATFASNKGKLPWPVEKGVITANFGTNPHPVLKNITTTNNGIDISTEPNANVRAVFDGKVSNILFNPTFQWAVIIKHGNYFTVYTNLKEPTVNKGDLVKTKETIGTVYFNEDENEAIVHLEVWESNNKMNPASWLYRK
ncbi:MAG: peptidoglycan DD-metalloendopeptidase family protein [Sphingobacteriales bacterium]|nr:MAG: peptidoglycan DD-metalloendopeptidase family protein [Sphingobacteriales bacterium]